MSGIELGSDWSIGLQVATLHLRYVLPTAQMFSCNLQLYSHEPSIDVTKIIDPFLDIHMHPNSISYSYKNFIMAVNRLAQLFDGIRRQKASI